MIVTSNPIMPPGYRINNVEVFVPLGLITGSHLLWPFALNPWFLSFSVSSFTPFSTPADLVSSRFGLASQDTTIPCIYNDLHPILLASVQPSQVPKEAPPLDPPPRILAS